MKCFQSVSLQSGKKCQCTSETIIYGQATASNLNAYGSLYLMALSFVLRFYLF